MGICKKLMYNCDVGNVQQIEYMYKEENNEYIKYRRIRLDCKDKNW